MTDPTQQLQQQKKPPPKPQINPLESYENMDKAKRPPMPQQRKPIENRSAGEWIEDTIMHITRIPENLIAEILGMPQNYTDLNNPDVKEQMQKSMDQQDGKDASIAKIKQDLRRQMQHVRQEEQDARQYFKEKEEDKKQEEAEEEKRKAQEEEERKKQAQQEEPTTKQKRGGLFAKKKKKTMENKASFGKQ